MARAALSQNRGSMSKGIIETIGGYALIAGGIGLGITTLGMSAPLVEYMITAGASLMLQGIGTMISKGPLHGFATTTRNPIAPWEGIYGRTRTGGTIIHLT